MFHHPGLIAFSVALGIWLVVFAKELFIDCMEFSRCFMTGFTVLLLLGIVCYIDSIT